ncbi:AlpA family transcriptional regulator [Paraburkholderia sp. J63]|uniref:helix-turn-helix transcriptional regulator n=1 Tax=Paraburkholderia sp. J63 TaxID=2805434 RepID=UPI002ABE1F89|nr:AlpA family transcriptional regulator [Paraburkholderia sp. J63]
MGTVVDYSSGDLSETVQNAYLVGRSHERSEFAHLEGGRKSCCAGKAIPEMGGGAPAAAQGDGGGLHHYQNCATRRHPVVPLSGNPPRPLRIDEVMHRVGFGRSNIYELMRRGKFPACVKIGGRSTAWVEAEISEWIESSIAARSERA